MIATDKIIPTTPVPQLKQVLMSVPGPFPPGWNSWPNVADAHRELFDEFSRRRAGPAPPMEGRGIVSCVSAKAGMSSGKNLAQGYMPGAWVMVKELRRLGCRLPITFANLGPTEWDSSLTKLMNDVGVSVMNLRDYWATDPWRILNGWETKPAAIIAAPYREVLFMDADNVPVVDPEYLFDEAQYKQAGAIFWPDLPPHDRKEWLPEVVWKSISLPYNTCRAVESGQILIDKEKCWEELRLCRFLNEHSDFWYALVFGDKDTFCLAWHKAAQIHGYPLRYAMPDKGAGWNGGAITQHDFQGHLVFEHGARNKATLDGFPHGRNCLTNPDSCIAHLVELRKLWNGKLWHNEVPTGDDATMARTLLHKTFIYRRVEMKEEREMRFLQDNRIGKGGARCEFSWSIVGGTLVVQDVDGGITFFANKNGDGTWHGQWENFERCKVELVPIENEIMAQEAAK